MFLITEKFFIKGIIEEDIDCDANYIVNHDNQVNVLLSFICDKQ